MRKFLIGLLTVAVMGAGCGGSDNNKSSSGGSASKAPAGAKKGGTLTVISQGDVDSLDPGYWYYQYDYLALGQTTQRGLYGWEPDKTSPTPDLADGQPAVSNGGKTITIKVKPGIKYSPPLQTQTVKAADFKYAIERCFLPQVGNGYVNTYLGDLDGLKAFKDGKAKEITGLVAKDDSTLEFHTTVPSAVLANANILALPCSAPVPKDYASKYDQGKQSTYGEHQVSTGPYMIERSGEKLTGYSPGKRIHLVRNPSWDAKTDYRPAYVDEIVFEGGGDLTVGSKKILSGSHMVSGDFAAPPTPVLKQALSRQKDQVEVTPSQGNRFIGFDTAKKPFDNENLRKAVIAATDREALRLTRGGETLGAIGSHFLPPGLPGFEEAGGQNAPPGADFLANPKGDMAVATKYMKAAGYPSGKYTGPQISMVGDDEQPASNTGEAFLEVLQNLGFKVNYRQVPHETMYSKFCQVPKNQPEVCVNLGWGKDFYDAQSMIDPIFNGKNIVPTGNVNYANINDPKLNAKIEAAKQETDKAKATRMWGDLDKEVTDRALHLTWLWDNQIQIRSKDVNGVVSRFNTSWDLTFTSLK
jgi:peptide/nickel transport system substrate-binding protein